MGAGGYGWGQAIGVLLSFFSPKMKIRRMKDELDKLQTERSLLLIQKATVDKAKRLKYIDDRIADIQRRLQNCATD